MEKRVQKTHKDLIDWLTPLGYAPVYRNHDNTVFHFTKDGTRVECDLLSGLGALSCTIFGKKEYVTIHSNPFKLCIDEQDLHNKLSKLCVTIDKIKGVI